jgi:hypothetical protein
MDRRLLWLAAIGGGIWLLARPPAAGSGATSGLPTIRQSLTLADTGQPYPIGTIVRVDNPNGVGSYSAVVVAG